MNAGCRSIPLTSNASIPTSADLISVEAGYGEPFGFTDERLRPLVGSVVTPRGTDRAQCDVVLLPKPTVEDLEEMRDGQILWGWPHCVQDAELTQVAIDRRLTLIAFEAMNHWRRRRFVQPACAAQEQRAGGLCVGAACAVA